MSQPSNEPGQNVSAVVEEFVRLINSRDANGLSKLMTDDHLFVDSLGNTVQGKDKMRKAWIAYFYMIPDFTVTVSEMFREGNTVALIGMARGTYSQGGKLPKHNSWEMPAAWKAVIRNGLVAEWHAFADNEPVRRIMANEGQSDVGKSPPS